jgi:hypothetical protein
VILALGLAILANSRPFEGLVVSLPAALVLVAWVLGKGRPAIRVTMFHVVLPALIVLFLAAVLMGINNYCVTGNVFVLPYQAYEAQRNQTHLTPDIVKTLHLQSVSDFVQLVCRRCNRAWFFYIGLLLTVPLAVLPWRRDRWTWFALSTCGLFLAAIILFETYFLPHYVAPVAGLMLILVLQGMRQMRTWHRHGKATGQFLVRALLLCMVISFLLMRWLQYEWVLNDWYRTPRPWNFYRAQIRSQLEEEGGIHLVMVRYAPKHNWNNEWVYNEADIDASKVVWSHDLDESQNRNLLAYFNDRRVWTVEADEKPPTLIPYTGKPAP